MATSLKRTEIISQPGRSDLEKLAELMKAAERIAASIPRAGADSATRPGESLQQNLLAALEMVPHGIAILDADARFSYFNSKFLEFHDRSRDVIRLGGRFDEFILAGRSSGQYLDAIDRSEAWVAARLLVPQGFELEEHLHGDRWVRVEERLLRNGGRVSIQIDITDLKRREQELERRSAWLLEAQRIGKIGQWTFRLVNDYVDWSPELWELLGHDPQKRSTIARADALATYVNGGAERQKSNQAESLRTRRIQAFDAQMRRADGSIGDFILTTAPLIENGEVVGFSGTVQDISDRKDAERALQRLAFYDPLTGLANRALFQKEMESVLQRCTRRQTSAALLLLDLDRFKEVNDSLGHAAGDELLSAVGQRLSRVLGAQHFFARLGGDEFAIIMEDCDRGSAQAVALEIVKAAHNPFPLSRGEATIGVSIGIAMLPADGASLTDAQRNADLALYRAKEDGRGRIQVFESQMSAVAQHKIRIARELRRALSSNAGLGVHYQPQIHLSSRTVVGCEALMRWRHPEMGAIAPSEFIPIAESSQLICDLGSWILREAARQARQWQASGVSFGQVSINISTAQVWQASFPQQVASILAESGLSPSSVCLELTESLLADPREGHVRSVLTELKRLGVKIALDDFGTGYSSLSYLTQLPFDSIKIDRVFIEGIAESERSRRLLQGMITLGQGLGMRVVAEGVEFAREVEILKDMQCDVVQGFAFARPAPADVIQRFLASAEEATL